MNLYLLEARNCRRRKDPWIKPYDCQFAVVSRAVSEEGARRIADESAGDERRIAEDVWLNPLYSVCTVITHDSGPIGLIVRDFNAG